eukprot:6904301-Prymnesium_polylepis.1
MLPESAPGKYPRNVPISHPSQRQPRAALPSTLTCHRRLQQPRPLLPCSMYRCQSHAPLHSPP